MTPLRTTSAILSGLAVLLLIVVQFTSWAHAEFEGGSTFGFTFPDSEFDAKTWEAESSAGGSSEDHSWYDSEADDEDGIGQIRAAIPILLVGLVAALGGAFVTLGVRGAAGPVIVLIAGLLTGVAVILFSTGVDSMLDGVSFDWAIAFYMAIVAGVLLVAGGALGLMAGNRGVAA